MRKAKAAVPPMRVRGVYGEDTFGETIKWTLDWAASMQGRVASVYSHVQQQGVALPAAILLTAGSRCRYISGETFADEQRTLRTSE